jgi:hypothetical protein
MKFKKTVNTPSAKPVGKLHVRVEYELDAQFISDIIDTGFVTASRITQLMEGKDIFTILYNEVETHGKEKVAT